MELEPTFRYSFWQLSVCLVVTGSDSVCPMVLYGQTAKTKINTAKVRGTGAGSTGESGKGWRDRERQRRTNNCYSFFFAVRRFADEQHMENNRAMTYLLSSRSCCCCCCNSTGTTDVALSCPSHCAYRRTVDVRSFRFHGGERK